MYGIIYSALNMKNGKRYIGQTIQKISERRKEHINRPTNDHFGNALKNNKGWFLWVIVDTANDLQELNNKETFWIQFYNTTNREYGYNKTSGGRASRPNDETKRKLSISGKARRISVETRKRMSVAQKKRKSNGRSGMTHTEETKAKISKAHMGKKQLPHSIDVRKRISLSMSEYVKSEEHKQKLSIAAKRDWERRRNKYISN